MKDIKKDFYLESIKECRNTINFCIIKILVMASLALLVIIEAGDYYELFYELLDGSKYLMFCAIGAYVLMLFGLLMYMASVFTEWDANRILLKEYKGKLNDIQE